MRTLKRAALSAIEEMRDIASKDDPRERLPQVRSVLTSLAAEARDTGSSAPSEYAEAARQIETLATLLDSAGHERLTLNSGWEEMEGAALAARDLANDLRARRLASETIGQESLDHLRLVVITAARRLQSLAERLDSLVDHNRIDEMQGAAGEIGLLLRKVAATAFPSALTPI